MPDVVVIGAGMAGVTAGRGLREAGVDVVVVEATDRIGGRIQTDYDLCGRPIEVGAEFVHTHGAEVWPEIGAAGLAAREIDTSDFWLSIGGRSLDDLLAEPQVAAVAGLLDDVSVWDGPDVSV